MPDRVVDDHVAGAGLEADGVGAAPAVDGVDAARGIGIVELDGVVATSSDEGVGARAEGRVHRLPPRPAGVDHVVAVAGTDVHGVVLAEEAARDADEVVAALGVDRPGTVRDDHVRALGAPDAVPGADDRRGPALAGLGGTAGRARAEQGQARGGQADQCCGRQGGRTPHRSHRVFRSPTQRSRPLLPSTRSRPGPPNSTSSAARPLSTSLPAPPLDLVAAVAAVDLVVAAAAADPVVAAASLDRVVPATADEQVVGVGAAQGVAAVAGVHRDLAGAVELVGLEDPVELPPQVVVAQAAAQRGVAAVPPS